MKPSLLHASLRLLRCQYCYAIDSRIDCVNERLQFVQVPIRPFVLKVLVDKVFERSNIALYKYRFHFTLFAVSSNAFVFTKLSESSFELGSFSRSYFQWFDFGYHATKSFLCTLCSQWLNSEFSRQYINRDKEVFNNPVVIR